MTPEDEGRLDRAGDRFLKSSQAIARICGETIPRLLLEQRAGYLEIARGLTDDPLITSRIDSKLATLNVARQVLRVYLAERYFKRTERLVAAGIGDPEDLIKAGEKLRQVAMELTSGSCGVMQNSSETTPVELDGLNVPPQIDPDTTNSGKGAVVVEAVPVQPVRSGSGVEEIPERAARQPAINQNPPTLKRKITVLRRSPQGSGFAKHPVIQLPPEAKASLEVKTLNDLKAAIDPWGFLGKKPITFLVAEARRLNPRISVRGFGESTSFDGQNFQLMIEAIGQVKAARRKELWKELTLRILSPFINNLRFETVTGNYRGIVTDCVTKVAEYRFVVDGRPPEAVFLAAFSETLAEFWELAGKVTGRTIVQYSATDKMLLTRMATARQKGWTPERMVNAIHERLPLSPKDSGQK